MYQNDSHVVFPYGLCDVFPTVRLVFRGVARVLTRMGSMSDLEYCVDLCGERLALVRFTKGLFGTNMIGSCWGCMHGSRMGQEDEWIGVLQYGNCGCFILGNPAHVGLLMQRTWTGCGGRMQKMVGCCECRTRQDSWFGGQRSCYSLNTQCYQLS